MASAYRYNRPVTMIGDDTFINTAFMPGTMTRPAGYLSFEVDQQGLPVPDADGLQYPEAYDKYYRSRVHLTDIPARKPRAERPEQHFRLDGAIPSVGVCYPEIQLFESITHMPGTRLVEIRESAQLIGESVPLADIAAIALDLCSRDRFDAKSYQHGGWLGSHSSDAAIFTAFHGKLTQIEDVTLDLDFMVNQEEVWQFLERPDRPTPAAFMEQWHMSRMQNNTLARLSMIKAVVTATILPAAAAIAADNIVGGVGTCETCRQPTPHVPQS